MSGRPSHQACNALALCTAKAFGTAQPQGSDGSNRTPLLRTPQFQMEVAASRTGWLHQHPPCCCLLARCLRRMHRDSCCARPSGNRQAQAQRSRSLDGRQRLPPAGQRAPPRLLLLLTATTAEAAASLSVATAAAGSAAALPLRSRES